MRSVRAGSDRPVRILLRAWGDAPRCDRPFRRHETMVTNESKRKRGSGVRLIASMLALCAMAVVGTGCASFKGAAPPEQSAAAQERWTKLADFPLVRQEKGDDCGAAALSAVVRYWGYPASAESIEAS